MAIPEAVGDCHVVFPDLGWPRLVILVCNPFPAAALPHPLAARTAPPLVLLGVGAVVGEADLDLYIYETGLPGYNQYVGFMPRPRAAGHGN